MEGERRKRKMEKVEIDNDDEEEEEEEKMNKFFALIRSTREVRERIITTTGAVTRDKVQNLPPPAATTVWNPTFRPEDFMDPRHNRVAFAVGVDRAKTVIDRESEAGPSNRGEELGKIVVREKEECNLKEKEREEIDLNLSL